jgi:ribosomal protein L37E
MGHFQVLFSGEVVEGAREAQVRINLAHKFGLDERKVGQLFSGRTVVIESGMEPERAYALQKELSDLGAVTRVKDRTPEDRAELKVDARDYKADRPHADYTLNDITAAHVECPRCGHLQLDAQSCARCGVDMTAASKQKRQEDRAIARELHQLGSARPRPSVGGKPKPRHQRPEIRSDQRRRPAPRRGLLQRLGISRG